MLLRDHPLMSHKGVRNWPPFWTFTGGSENKHPKGEIGILKAVDLSRIQPSDRCFLHIDHEGSSYIGCLLFDDALFCNQIANLLRGCCNRPIADIGSLDLPEIAGFLQKDVHQFADNHVQRRKEKQPDPSILFGKVTDAAVALMHADMGNIQLFDPTFGGLKIVAQRGFNQPFVEFFNHVHPGEAACGTALKLGKRVIVEDVANSPIFSGAPREMMLGAEARAVQSAPLISSSGDLLGMLSTHHRKPHCPNDHELHLIDLLAYQTSKWIELVVRPQGFVAKIVTVQRCQPDGVS